jgi:hypothetical protein
MRRRRRRKEDENAGHELGVSKLTRPDEKRTKKDEGRKRTMLL